MSKTIKKNFFAPLASGLCATRRAAMLLLVMKLIATTVWAQEAGGKCGSNVTWMLTGATLTISGSGYMYNYSDAIESTLWSSYANSIAPRDKNID